MGGEPMTPLGEEAVKWHEAFGAFTEAGFTDEQALQIVIALIVNAISGEAQ